MHHRLGTGASEKKVTSGCIPGVVSIVLPLRQGRLQERPINWPRDDGGEKGLTKREKRTSPVSAAFASLANLRLIYLDNISPRRSIV